MSRPRPLAAKAHSSAVCPHSQILALTGRTPLTIGRGGKNFMLSFNPFAVAGASLPAGSLQGFLVLMAVSVVAGTLFDMVHKGSARYFFNNMTKSRAKGRDLGGGELVS